jgi:hypothetical protein
VTAQSPQKNSRSELKETVANSLEAVEASPKASKSIVIFDMPTSMANP